MDCKEMILSNDFAELIVDFPASEFTSAGGFCAIEVTTEQQIVYLPRTEEMMELDAFAYRYVPKLYGLMRSEPENGAGAGNAFDPVSLEVSGILEVQRPPLSLTGRGVVLAFVDTGIDYTNEVFRKRDGSSRILALWDQTIQTGTPPEGFYFGSEYTKEEIDMALESENAFEMVPSRDTDGHGTAMASVAGGGRETFFQGAAPDADLVVVKLRECKPYLREYYGISEEPAYAETDIMLAVKYVQSFLVSFERPVVLCLGMGTNWGDHTGSSQLAKYLTALAMRRSMEIVVCGGNEGNAEHHYQGRLERGQSRENFTDVEIRVGENERGIFLEFWGNVPDAYRVEIRSPGGETLTGPAPDFRQSIHYRFVYERTEVSVYSVLVESDTGEQLILMRFRNPTAGIWRIRVSPVGEVQNGTFHMWLPNSSFLTSEAFFLEGTPDVTLTEPSNASGPITVSAYNDENNSFYVASGRGFTRKGRIKPDLSAPGVKVSTILGEYTGSSMAAAITAGAVAQFMQWAVVEDNREFVTSMDVRNYLIRGAKRDSDVGYPDKRWGYGRLDIAGTFDAIAGI